MAPEPPAFDIPRVLDAMKARKVTQTDMAKVMKLPSQSAFSNIVKGIRRVTAEEAAVAYRFLGFAMPSSPDGVQHVPIIGLASAGAWREAVQMPIGSMSVPPGRASKRAFAVEVQGDSCDKVVQHGGYLVIDPDEKELRPGRFYLIENDNGESTIKCYQRDPARFEPASHNDTHADIPAAEVERVIGRAVWKADPL